MRRVSQVRTLTPNFCRFGLVNVGLRPKKITKNGNFWYKFAPKGYIPLRNFYKILPGGGSPKTAPACHCGLHIPWAMDTNKCTLETTKINNNSQGMIRKRKNAILQLARRVTQLRFNAVQQITKQRLGQTESNAKIFFVKLRQRVQTVSKHSWATWNEIVDIFIS